MKSSLALASLLFFIFHSAANAETKKLKWEIRNTEWTAEMEQKWQQFIYTLGMERRKGNCKTTDQCLKSPVANPMFAAMNPRGLMPVYSDCADLPYVLRAYFSWMNDLPFTFPTEMVEAKSFSRRKSDIRYSKNGNIIVQKYNVKQGDDINDILQSAVDATSTASFRTDPAKYDSGKNFRDTYSVDINRKAIAPGTVVYDANGHVAVVYEVTKNGQVHMIDAHPDNSLTTITYGPKFSRTSQKIGGGFSNFRPFRYERANIIPLSNQELPGFSLIQYSKDPFILKGKVVSYYEYVRGMLSDGDVVYDPINEFNDQLTELCMDLKYREESVNLALDHNIDDEPHPDKLPASIYGSDGDWEIYSTPSRDTRMKAMIKSMKEFLMKVTVGERFHNVKMSYSGDDIVKDLRELYRRKSNECEITVKEKKKLNLDRILQNLFALSFDPYHCAELRWGLRPSGSCLRDKQKLAWYKAEQGLRNRTEIDYGLKTDYDVQSLPHAPASQVEKPDLSFDQVLQIDREN